MSNRIEDLIEKARHYENLWHDTLDENARLKAEVEELKSQPDPLTAYLYADTLRRDDIKTLKAHIERLTKAGDAMAWLINCQNDDAYYGFDNEKHASTVAWNAAKEGKQS